MSFVPYLLFLQKIFLDTTRLLGERTDNLIDELWNYIKEGRLVESAILLLATQKQIRGWLSCNRNGKNKQDGFYVLINRILDHIVSLDRDQTGKENQQLVAQKKLAHVALLFMQFPTLVKLLMHISDHIQRYNSLISYCYYNSSLFAQCVFFLQELVS
jgi:hypothetical protein